MLNVLLKKLSENNQLVLNQNSLSGQFYVNSDVLKMLFKSETDSSNNQTSIFQSEINVNEGNAQSQSETFEDLNDFIDPFYSDGLVNTSQDSQIQANINTISESQYINQPVEHNFGTDLYYPQQQLTNIQYEGNIYQPQDQYSSARESKEKCQELCCLLMHENFDYLS